MKLVEVKAAKEFASTFFGDPVLKMAVNAVLDNTPGFDLVRCKDCMYSDYAFEKYWCEYHWNKYKCSPSPFEVKADGFCNNGERKNK